MKKTSIVLLAAVLSAGTGFGQIQDGGQAGAFLRMGFGARAVSMGRAFVAVADDASTAYWNPAGLSLLDFNEFMGSYSLLSMDRRLTHTAVALPTASMGTFAVSWVNLHVGGIERRDAFGQTDGTFTNGESAYSLSWGFALSSRLRLGITGKYIVHSLADHQSSGLGFDAGILYTFSDYFRLGASLQDISTRVVWDTDSRTEEAYPMMTRMGVSFIPEIFPIPLTLGIGYSLVENQEGMFHTGFEANLMSGFGIRAGVDGGRIGFGGFVSVPMKNFNLQTDYSFGQDPIDATYVHKLSLQIKFAPSDYYFIDMRDRLRDVHRTGYRQLMTPPPDARIIRTVAEFPEYALINLGWEGGVEEGQEFEVQRNGDEMEEPEEREVIARVIVVRVEQKESAVRVDWLKEGYNLRQGDVLVSRE